MISVRAAATTDKMSVARVHVRSWQVGYRGLMPDEYLGRIQAEERAAQYTFGEGDEAFPVTVVAVEAGSVLGFASFGAARDADCPDHGEIFALYVDPDSWGRGVGKTLISRARTSLREQSFAIANLWVLSGNDRAIRFYERDGWTPDGSSRDEVIWGITVNELRLTRTMS